MERAVLFAGQFPLGRQSRGEVQHPLRTLRQASSKLVSVLLGYSVHPKDVDSQLAQLQSALFNPQLPLLELQEVLSVLCE